MTTDLVPADNMNALDAMEPATREVAVTNMLDEARQWLAHAVEATQPQAIADFKARMATVAEATKQLGLSKEIQGDAREMVRRGEQGLGKAIRKGQDEGTIGRQGSNQSPDEGGRFADTAKRSSPYDFASHSDLYGDGTAGGNGVYALVDGVTDEQFEDGLAAAKAEGNLSRANVVRKVKKQAGPITRDQRAELIADLAAQGYSSRQMPAKVGVTEGTVRQIARHFDIEIHADKTIGRAHRIDSNRVVNETCSALAGLAIGVDLIDYEALDATLKGDWADSLTESLSKLNALHRRFNKEMKESTQ